MSVAAELTPTWVVHSAAVRPDATTALAFLLTLFPEPGGTLHLRAVAEPHDGRTSINHHYALDSTFERNFTEWLEWAEGDERAAFFLPGLVTPNGTKKEDVLSLTSILVDFDRDAVDENLAAAEAVIGPATMIVGSGGSTEAGTRKRHAYWLLTESATGSDIDVACGVREELARRFGGDTAFKQAAQVVRVAGSVHRKGEPRMVTLDAHRPELKYSLAEISAKLQLAPPKTSVPKELEPEKLSQPAGFDFDFNNVTPLFPESRVERALTAPIRSEGQDDITRFEGAGTAIGHFISNMRDGAVRWTTERAWEATCGWNQATLRPPWNEVRLRTDFDRILARDIEERGPMPTPIQAEPLPALTTGWPHFERWGAEAYRGQPEPIKWLVPGTFPVACTVLIAGDGGVGKSYIMLDLAVRVAGEPASDDDMDFNDRLIFGDKVAQHGVAVVLTTEDSKHTVHSRLHALDPSGARFKHPGRLVVVPVADAGGAHPLFQDTGRKRYAVTDAYLSLRQSLLAYGSELKMVVLDMLAAFAGVDINGDPDAGVFVFNNLNTLASETGATLFVTHHVSKTTKAITSGDECRAAVRGTTALINGPRIAYGIWKLPSEDDEGISAVGSILKENMGAITADHHYRRMPSGVLRQVQRTPTMGNQASIMSALEAAIAAAAARGMPFMMTGKDGVFENRERLPEGLRKISRRGWAKWGKMLVDEGRIVRGTAHGSKDRKWLDVPGGSFDMGYGKLEPGAWRPE